jgi:hypothetical protein
LRRALIGVALAETQIAKRRQSWSTLSNLCRLNNGLSVRRMGTGKQQCQPNYEGKVT